MSVNLIRCYTCRVFFAKEKTACPECGAARRPHNEALVSQRWRSNLDFQAHRSKHT